METTKRTGKAASLRAEITENVRAEAAGEIDWEAFHVRQCATWDKIRAAGTRVENAVLTMMRRDFAR